MWSTRTTRATGRSPTSTSQVRRSRPSPRRPSSTSSVMTPETPIDCAPGHIFIGTRRVNDTHRYGALSFTDVIVKSSNVGAIKAGFRVGAEQMQRYVRRFGFGTRLMRDLPGEEPGIVWNELIGLRAGIGVDGLPDRRHAAADGDRRQLDCQRRATDAAAPRARDDRERPAQDVCRRGDPAHRLARDRRDADGNHGRRRRSRHRQDLADRRLHDRREDGHVREDRERPVLERRSTTRPSSASSRRASRPSPCWS